MRKMPVLELVCALFLVCLLGGLGLVGALVWSLVRRAEGQAMDVAELKARLQSGGQSQETQAAELREPLSHTQVVVEGLRSALSARQPVAEEARASLRRLESVIPARPTPAPPRDTILHKTLRPLPPY